MPVPTIPSDLTARFGALSPLGQHAGVRVYKKALDGGAAAFIKLYTDEDLARREASLLDSPVPMRTPLLLESERLDSGWVVATADARAGLDRRARRLSTDHIADAAALLGRLHTWAPPARVRATDPPAWRRQVQRRAANPDLPEALRIPLHNMVIIGDAFCHRDLHPSNWLLDGGAPVGLLDWSSAGFADPEYDLAQLVLAAGGDPTLVAPVCARWSDVTGRIADVARTWIYLWLLHEERPADKPGRAEAIERLDAGRDSLPDPHGLGRYDRALPAVKEQDHHDTWVPVAPQGVQLVQDGLAAPLALDNVSVKVLGRFGGHACNDVLRIRIDGQPHVLKIYNKPLKPWLVPLEQWLSRHLPPGVVVVPSLVRFGNRGFLTRFGPRPTVLYEELVGEPLENTRGDARRLARAQAALHALPVAAWRDVMPIEAKRRLKKELITASIGRISDPPTRVAAHDLWTAVQDELDGFFEADLPEAFCHGSIHRDHCVWVPGKGVAIFDFEKTGVGPRVMDLGRTAIYVGYRGNDEVLDPNLLVAFLTHAHRAHPLTAQERRWLYPALLRCMFHDLRAMAENGVDSEALARHMGILQNFARNRPGLESAFERYLGDGPAQA